MPNSNGTDGQETVLVEFNPRQVLLIQMLADVTDSRTLEEKSVAAGYHEKRVYDLRRNPAFRAEVTRLMRGETQAYLAEAYRRLIQLVNAKSDDIAIKALRLFMQTQSEISNDIHFQHTQNNVLVLAELEGKSELELVDILRGELKAAERLQEEDTVLANRITGTPNEN